MQRLSQQQIRFIDAIMEGKNRTDAYINAGYKIRNRRNVRSAAARLYANPIIQGEIQRREKIVRRRNSHHLARLSSEALDELNKMIRDCDNERVKLDAIKAVLDYAGLRPEAESAHHADLATIVTFKDVVLGLGQRNEALALERWHADGEKAGELESQETGTPDNDRILGKEFQTE